MEEPQLKEACSKYHMIGGDGPDSYAHNSAYQKELLVSAKDLIYKLINEHDLDTDKPPFNPQKTFRIADLGCSVGPNTFFAVENIIAAIENKYKSKQNQIIPEFHVFFNDLIDNDFNTLFRNLPPSRNYLASGVPGSFHARLFPRSTIHIAHCSTALHWLSRIPEGVRERSSIAWNKGRVHYFGAREEVKEAYSCQYKQDMEAFLSARGTELVDGGLLVLVILGFPDGVISSESATGVALNMLGSCLQDLAKQGKIDEEKVDSFNLPFYYPCPSELKALIEGNGLFDIVRIAKLGSPMRVNPDVGILTSHLRAVTGVLIEEHFGNGVIDMDELFRLQLEKHGKSPILTDPKYWKEMTYLVFLKRKD